MKTLSFILMLIFPAVLIAQQNRHEYSPLDYMWMNVGNPGFSSGEVDYTSLAFNASGEPCVAFKDGQECLRQMISDHRTLIDIGNLPGGVYFLKLSGSKILLTEKMIKQ